LLDAQYLYCSTFHWYPLVNGYSGVYPSSYLERIERLKDFPDARSFEQLDQDNVQYVVLHDWEGRPEAERVLSQSPDYMLLGEFGDVGVGSALLYQRRH
jgi:hypothetical protein